MNVFTTEKDLQTHLNKFSNNKNSIGFIPTMGALHIGHISLVDRSLQENNITIVSVFVNPTQFDNTSDLSKYPRTLEKDIELLSKCSKSIIIFAPTANNLYNGTPRSTKYSFNGLENQMEGKYRSGHFDGVGTVLTLLFNAVKPTRSYFGEKDFQQLQIVKSLVKQYSLPVDIIGCSIFREENGLAFSSRNERLTTNERSEAKLIFEILSEAKKQFGIKSVKHINEMVLDKFKHHPLFKLEYFEIASVDDLQTTEVIEVNKKYRAFLAVYADQVRLIDNIALN